MSSINEALRRASGGGASGGPSGSYGGRRPPGRNSGPWIFLALVVIGLAAAFWFLWPQPRESLDPRVPEAQVAVRSAPQATPAPEISASHQAPAGGDALEDIAAGELPEDETVGEGEAAAGDAELEEAAGEDDAADDEELQRLEKELAELDAQVARLETAIVEGGEEDEREMRAAVLDREVEPSPERESSGGAGAVVTAEDSGEESAADHFLAGRLAQDNGRDSQAVYHYRQALLKDPGLTEAYLNLGNIFYFRQRSPEKAREMYMQVLTVDPENKMAHNNLGVIFLREGRDAQAETEFTAALQRDPDYVDALYNLACVKARQGEAGAAMERLSRAVELQPEAAVWAAEDEDLKTLWPRPDFKRLVRESRTKKPQG